MWIDKPMILCKRDRVMVSGCPGWDSKTPKDKCDLCTKKRRRKK